MRALKGSEIRQAREALGMSQAEFASALHLRFRSVQKWEQEGVPAGPTAVLLWLVSKMPRRVVRMLKDF
jgi:DNA-binding transcriptional regulator YiaG